MILRKLSLSRVLLPLLFTALVPFVVHGQVVNVLALDAKGDGRDPSLADAAQLSYRYDKAEDFLWFRIVLYNKPNEEAFGVNLVFDTGADESAKTNWWGGNKDFKFDKLVTAWVTRGSDGYTGTIGMADKAGVEAKQPNNLVKNNIKIRVEGNTILLGFKRTDLTDQLKMKVIAAVGSNQRWNDDVPNTNSGAIDLSIERPKRGLREIDLGRNNLVFSSDYKTLSENQTPSIIKKGTGPQPVILLPGVYSANEVFDGFMARNQSRYRFYVVIPPGLMGTPARQLPPETVSYSELPWTRHLERDVLKMINREKLRKPIIVAHGFPGSLAANELAALHPEILGGVVDVASFPVSPMVSLSDPARKTPASPKERTEYTDEMWAKQWFRYVTPETWDSNNYPVDMYTNDTARGERLRQQAEAVSLSVKIRYLIEYMAADQTQELNNISIPVLVLRPGFNQKLLADPTTSSFKRMFQDSWDPFSTNAHLQIQMVTGARAFILDDQPAISDEAIKKFIENIAKPSAD